MAAAGWLQAVLPEGTEVLVLRDPHWTGSTPIRHLEGGEYPKDKQVWVVEAVISVSQDVTREQAREFAAELYKARNGQGPDARALDVHGGSPDHATVGLDGHSVAIRVLVTLDVS